MAEMRDHRRAAVLNAVPNAVALSITAEPLTKPVGEDSTAKFVLFTCVQL